MRLLVDLEAAQYSMENGMAAPRWCSLIERMAVEAPPRHDLHVLLNSNLARSAVQLRNRFETVIGVGRVHHHAGSARPARSPEGGWLERAMNLVRHAAIAHAEPDVMLVADSLGGPVAGLATTDTSSTPVVRLISDADRRSSPGLARHSAGALGPPQPRGELTLVLGWSRRLDDYARADTGQRVRYLTDSVWAWGEVDTSVVEGAAGAHMPHVARPYVLALLGRDGDAPAVLEGLAQYAADPSLPRVVIAVDGEDIPIGLEGLGVGGGPQVVAGGDARQLAWLFGAATAIVAPTGCDAGAVLDAMMVGCPAVASEASSIAGLLEPDRRFDSGDPTQVADCVRRAVRDGKDAPAVQSARTRAFEMQLSEAARSAWGAFDDLLLARRSPATVPTTSRQRPRLAIVSPFPPTPSGVARYSVELARALRSHYRVDLVDPVRRAGSRSGVRSRRWFVRHASDFDRVLYHFGNSRYHWPMFDLIERVPGVVVLHDIFLSGVVSDAHFRGVGRGAWPRMLFESHGYPAVHELTSGTSEATVWRYPTNRYVLERADGVVVHSEHAKQLASDLLGERLTVDWVTIPLARSRIDASESARRRARVRLGIAADEFVVASFGMLGPTKLNDRLLDAYLSSALGGDERCQLVFVGGHAGGLSDDQFLARLEQAGNSSRLTATGHVRQDDFDSYLLAADVAVQLRTHSRGEASAAVLDCLSAGVPVIVNAHGSAIDLPADAVLRVPDDFTDADLVSALERLRSDGAFARSMARMGQEFVARRHDPDACASQFVAEIERFSTRPWSRTVLAAGVRQLGRPARGSDAALVCRTLAATISPPGGRRQLLVDVTGVAGWTPRCGRERVQCELLSALLRNPPIGWAVEPVRATGDGAYRYARALVQQLLAPEIELGPDVPIDVSSGDVLLTVGSESSSPRQEPDALLCLRAAGVRVHAVVLPRDAGSSDDEIVDMRRSLTRAVELGGVAFVAPGLYEDARQLVEQGGELGCAGEMHRLDVGASLSALHPPTPTEVGLLALLENMRERPSFLMVGPFEARKSHREVVAGFEHVWQAGVRAGLVVVGDDHRGDPTIGPALRAHPEFGRRLFLTGHVSDATLGVLYCFAQAAVSASTGGGLGTTCAEALYHGVPLLARDTPIYRALAGSAAVYFADASSRQFVEAVRTTLEVERSNPPRSVMTWSEATARLLAHIGVG